MKDLRERMENEYSEMNLKLNELERKEYQSVPYEEKIEARKERKELKKQMKEKWEEVQKAREEAKSGEKELELKKEQEKISRLEAQVQGKTTNEVVKTFEKDLIKDITNEIESHIDRSDDYLGVPQEYIDNTDSETWANIQSLYDNESINSATYESLYDKMTEIKSNVLEKKGYEAYLHEGKYYYSQLPQAKQAYDNLLKKLSNKNYQYQVSRSWNAGELPSVYVKLKNGGEFRISNHFNSKNGEIDAKTLIMNKVYSNKDYIKNIICFSIKI